MVSSDERRRQILEKLAQAGQPVTGAELAREAGVSRQVIVQDIALLRAGGSQILATPRGYFLQDDAHTKCRRTYAVRHDQEGLEQELLIMVDQGGTVLDVVVEHPLYGEIRGLLMLSCREDVYGFVNNLKHSGALPLSSLTGGVHLHTVEAAGPEVLDKIAGRLAEANILLAED